MRRRQQRNFDAQRMTPRRAAPRFFDDLRARAGSGKPACKGGWLCREHQQRDTQRQHSQRQGAGRHERRGRDGHPEYQARA